MTKIAMTKGTLIVIIIAAVLVAGGVSAGVTVMLVGPQGAKGDTGATGATGPSGATGATGQAGPTGAQGPKGDNGATGATGAVGATGSQGPYLPDFDSGWSDITGKQGQFITVNHNLNYTNLLIDITGKTTTNGNIHQKYLGLTGYIPGWNKTIGATGDDVGNSIVQTSDGGYTIAGYTSSFGISGYDVYLVRTDSVGNMVWSKAYGGAGNDYGYCVIQTSDGGYAIAGQTSSYGAGNYDVYLIKTDSVGNMVWNKTYGGVNADVGYSVVQTSDGGYTIAGYTSSFGISGNDVYLVKTDSIGNMVWNKTYGGVSNDVGYSVVQTSDSGYAIAGYTGSFRAGFIQFYLVKTDSLGNKLWEKTYGGSSKDYGYSVVQASDGGYAITGSDSDYYVFLVKTDALGNLQWSKTYGGANNDVGYSVVQASDGGYAITGSTIRVDIGSSNSGPPLTNNVFLVKTDSVGNMVWNRMYAGAGADYGYCVIQDSDGRYVIAGSTNSFGAGNKDVYLIKTDLNGEFGLARGDSTANTLMLYRGANDIYWNYVRVQIWKID